ncbi:unnamed protein product [Chrysoparadoxa australica]
MVGQHVYGRSQASPHPFYVNVTTPEQREELYVSMENGTAHRKCDLDLYFGSAAMLRVALERFFTFNLTAPLSMSDLPSPQDGTAARLVSVIFPTRTYLSHIAFPAGASADQIMWAMTRWDSPQNNDYWGEIHARRRCILEVTKDIWLDAPVRLPRAWRVDQCSYLINMAAIEIQQGSVRGDLVEATKRFALQGTGCAEPPFLLAEFISQQGDRHLAAAGQLAELCIRTIKPQQEYVLLDGVYTWRCHDLAASISRAQGLPEKAARHARLALEAALEHEPTQWKLIARLRHDMGRQSRPRSSSGKGGTIEVKRRVIRAAQVSNMI